MATFGPRRLAAFRALWRAVSQGPGSQGPVSQGPGSQGRRPGSPGVDDRFRALPRMVPAAVSGRYADLGRGRLALFALAIAYLLSPVDLVPEVFLGLLGLTDDAVVALWLAGAFLAETDRFLDWERTRPTAVDQPPLP